MIAPLASAQSATSASFALSRPDFTVTSGASNSASHALLGCLNQGPSGSAASASFQMTAGCGVALLSGLLPPTVAKAFAPAQVPVGATSRLTISLGNPNGIPINGATFTDSYPVGLVNAAAPNISNSCGGSVTAAPSGPSIALAGGTIPAGGCQLVVDVIARLPGAYTNRIDVGAIQSIDAPPNLDATQATLVTAAAPIPTLGPYALMLLCLLVAGAGAAGVRRRD